MLMPNKMIKGWIDHHCCLRKIRSADWINISFALSWMLLIHHFYTSFHRDYLSTKAVTNWVSDAPSWKMLQFLRNVSFFYPLGRSQCRQVVITIFTKVVRPSPVCLYVPKLQNQAKFNASWDWGLAEWIIDVSFFLQFSLVAVQERTWEIS